MRTLENFRVSWGEILRRRLSEFESWEPRGEDQVATMKTYFRVMRHDHADRFRDLATAEMMGPDVGEQLLLRRVMGRHMAMMLVLEDLIVVPSEPEEPLSEEFADPNLALPLIAEIGDPDARDLASYGFVMRLATVGQHDRARSALYSLDFASPLMRFWTVLGLAEKAERSGHAGGTGWNVARSAADGLSANQAIRRRELAKARAYVSIYRATDDPLDLFVARKTITNIEAKPDAEALTASNPIDGEDQALGFLIIHRVTGDPADLEMARAGILRVTETERCGALITLMGASALLEQP